MISKTVSIICFSVLLSGCYGCSTFYPTLKEQWTLPPKPKTEKVKIDKINNGFYLTANDAKKMADNVDELKAYIEKLEILVREMAKYYNAKVEEK